jgi:hypothetical protein
MHASSHTSHLHLFRSLSRSVVSSTQFLCHLSLPVHSPVSLTPVYFVHHPSYTNTCVYAFTHQVLRSWSSQSVAGSPPAAMHRLPVYVYIAYPLHSREYRQHMWLDQQVSMCVNARSRPPPRRVLLLHPQLALSHMSHLHISRSPFISVKVGRMPNSPMTSISISFTHHPAL